MRFWREKMYGESMRKRVSLLLIIFLCASLSSCSEAKTVDNHIFKIGSENDSEYILATMQMDRGYIDNIVRTAVIGGALTATFGVVLQSFLII